MNNEAFITGFVKRASEYGFNENEAVELLKSSSTRGMREFRAGTPAGKAVEEQIRKALGEGPLTEDNIAMIRDNPRGIAYGSKGNLSEKLRDAVLENDPRHKLSPLAQRRLMYGDRPVPGELERSHLQKMHEFYLRDNGIFPGSHEAPFASGVELTPRQKRIALLGDRARNAAQNVPMNSPIVQRNIAEANASNMLSAMARKQQEAQRAALTAASKPIVQTGSKLKSLLSKLFRK